MNGKFWEKEIHLEINQPLQFHLFIPKEIIFLKTKTFYQGMFL